MISLHPFPHSYSIDADQLSARGDGNKGKDDEKMQGLVCVTKLPELSERGVSVGGGEDMAFAVSRRRVVIGPFHLPPLEGDEPKKGEGGQKEKEKQLEF